MSSHGWKHRSTVLAALLRKSVQFSSDPATAGVLGGVKQAPAAAGAAHAAWRCAKISAHR